MYIQNILYFFLKKVIEYSMSKNKKMLCKCRFINVLLNGCNKKY